MVAESKSVVWSSAKIKAKNNDDRSSMFDIPVDRGWAWVVLAGAAFKEILLGGMVHMVFGVMYLEFIDYYSADAASTAWVGAIAVAVACLFGPIAAYVAVKWSVRNLAFITTILTTSGFIISMFVPNVLYLYLTFGLMIGIADGAVFTPAMGLLNCYFEKRIGLAMGIGNIGSGIGQIIGPPLFVYLLDIYGLRGTLLIWAGIQLNHAVCALLMRPTSFYTKWQARRRLRSMSAANGACIQARSGSGAARPVAESDHSGNEKTCKYSHPAAQSSNGAEFCKLIRNPYYMTFNIGLSFTFITYVPLMALIIPAHGDAIGLSLGQVALQSTFLGVGTTIGRPLLGYISDRKLVPAAPLFNCQCFLSGILMLVYPHLGNQLEVVSIMSVLIGFTSSPMLTMPFVLLTDLVTAEEYTVACGWMGIFLGVPNLFNYVVFAYLSERFGSWNISFYLCGICSIVGGMVMHLSHAKKMKNSNRNITTKM